MCSVVPKSARRPRDKALEVGGNKGVKKTGERGITERKGCENICGVGNVEKEGSRSIFKQREE